MGFAAPSDHLLQLALIGGAVVFALTLVLLLAITVLRALLTYRSRCENQLGLLWQPVFFHAIENLPYETPALRKQDRELVLLQWIEMVESIRGEARDRLRTLALSLHFDRIAHEFLESRRFRTRLIGITVLGRLHDEKAWGPLVDVLENASSLLSLVAAHALLQIDPVRALPGVFEQVRKHNDWPLAKVASMLTEVRSPAVSDTLKNTLALASPVATPRLLMLLTITQVDDPWLLLEPFLRPDQPVPVLAAALKVCRDPRALPAVRALARHENWIVRAQASIVIGHLGGKNDEALLRDLLSDREWWVRYRAARALAELPFMTRQLLAALSEQVVDRFAQQILQQVLAETDKAAL